MKESPKRTSPGKISSWHLPVLAYSLALGALVTIIAGEKWRIDVPVSMTRAVVTENHDSKTSLAIHGGGMHGNVRVLHAANMVDERARTWEILPGISVRAVAVKGRIALAACFINKLTSVDLSTPGGPTLLDSLELPAHIKTVRIVGNRALVGMAHDKGMAIIDLSHPEELKLSAIIPLKGSVADMVTVGESIYYADIYRGLGRINLAVENPSPEFLDAPDKPWRLAVSGNRLVAASVDNNLFFYNISPEDSVEKAGTLNLPDLNKGGVRGLAFLAGTLAVAVSDGSIRVFSLAAWPKLQEVSRLPVPGVPYRVMPVVGRDRLVVSLVSAGVALIDVKPSASAVVSGHLMLPSTVIAMAVQDDAIYASMQAGLRGLVAFSMEGIEQSSFVPATYVDRNYHALSSWNGRLFGYRRDKTLVALADQGRSGSPTSGPVLPVHDQDGVTLFRMSKNGEVSLDGSIMLESGALDAVYSEGSLHVLHRGGLRILSDPQLGEVVVVGDMELSGQPVHLRTLEPGYILVTTKEEGLKVVDVSDRTHPVQIAEVRPPEHLQSSFIAHDIFINGKFAYVSQGSGGLNVIDLGDPRHPELVQIVDTPGLARKMVLHDGLLLVADGDKGIYMLDASMPGRLLPIGSLPTPLRANEIATVPDGILISNYPGGTLKLPYPEKLDNYRIVSRELLQSEAPASGAGYVYLYDEHSQNRVLIENPPD